MKKFKLPQDGMGWVYLIRNTLYIVAIVTFFGVLLYRYAQASQIRNEIESVDAFFPPDLVPHPIPPWDDPREKPDESKGTLCEQERGPREAE